MPVGGLDCRWGGASAVEALSAALGLGVWNYEEQDKNEGPEKEGVAWEPTFQKRR